MFQCTTLAFCLERTETNIHVQLRSHHHPVEYLSSRKAISALGPKPSNWRIQQHHMYMTRSANDFKVIKETVAAVIWELVSFLLWSMAGSRSHFAKLLFCGTITSLFIWSAPPLHYERWREEGFSKKGLERDGSNGRREYKEQATKDKIGKDKRTRNIRGESGR